MSEKWTFGCEFEWGDIDRRVLLPPGFGWDERDCTIVNSNGIANDPKGRLYRLGGEINTPPTPTIYGQQEALQLLKALFPEAVVNYRSNLHAHIRVPGLKDDLRALKRITQYNAHWLPIVLPIIEPIPEPKHTFVDEELFPFERLGALRRYKRRKRSHHTVLSKARTDKQLTAHTLEEFFRAEVPQDKLGRPMWHAQPRAAVNLRQLLQTDTIEFRHSPGTLDPEELGHFLEWCEHYLLCALCPTWGRPEALDPWQTFKPEMKMRAVARFPAFPEYRHALEIRYRMTCHDGSLYKDAIINNIKAIEDGSFNDAEAERTLKW